MSILSNYGRLYCKNDKQAFTFNGLICLYKIEYCAAINPDMENLDRGFTDALLDWFNTNGRTFRWREQDLTPFEVLLTEMFLKRTRAETVDSHLPDIFSELNTPEQVVKMDQDELIDLIRPFGLYNRRSKNIKNVCGSIIEQFGGQPPRTRDELLEINGIGEYIADAIRCFGYKEPVLVVDTNVAAVAKRYFGIEPASDLRHDESIRSRLQPLVPVSNPKIFNWGLIDLGAVLQSENPSCPDCPLQIRCSRCMDSA